MNRAEHVVRSLLEVDDAGTRMTEEKAWDILKSYCIGNRKYHTTDTVDALSWALNELRRRGAHRPQEVVRTTGFDPVTP